MASLATVAQLSAKIGEEISDPLDVAMAERMLEDASVWVRHYAGQPDWEVGDGITPGIAVTITIAAAARGYLNPAGYMDERSDASNIERHDSYANDVKLTVDEIAVLTAYNTDRRYQIQSIQLRNPDGLIPRSSRSQRPNFEVGYQEPFSTGS